MFDSLSFPVALMDIPHPSIDQVKIPKRKAIVRTDTNEVLNIVSDSYPLIKHIDVFGPMQDAINAIGLPIIKVTERSAYSGGYARVEWELDKSFKVDDGIEDDLNVTITARNSYNYSSVVGLELGTLRWICTNGLTVGHLIAGAKKRHVPNLKVPDLIKEIVEIIAKTADVQARMTKWSTIEYPRDRFSKWLDKQIIAKPARQAILDYYAIQPDRVRVGGQPAFTGWEALNSISWYSTHKATARREDLLVLSQERIQGLAHKFTRDELGSRN